MKSRVSYAGALVAVLLLASCGSGASNSPATKPKAMSKTESLDAALQAVGSGGYLTSVPIPGGGSALLQPAKKGVGAVFTLTRHAVVLDENGAVTNAFDLPKTLLSLNNAVVVVDRYLYFVGAECNGVIEDSEAEGSTCGGAAPGPISGYVLDLDTGAPVPLELPEGIDVNDTSQARGIGLYRAGDRPFLVSGVDGTNDWSAWVLAKDGTWTDVEAPSSLPCQVGDNTVEVSVKLQNPGDPNVPTKGDLTKTKKFLVNARVFDPGSRKWRADVPGPTTESAIHPATLCSTERLSIAALGAPPVAVSNFDPVSATWSSGSLTPEAKVVTTFAANGFGFVLVSDFGPGSTRCMAVYDPVNDVTQAISWDFESTVMYFSLSASSLMLVDRDGSHKVVRVP